MKNLLYTSVGKRVLYCTLSALFSMALPTYTFGQYQFERKFGATGTLDGEFQIVVGIALGDDGNIYVTDLNNRIQVFTSEGVFIRKFGTSGTGDGQFDKPYSIAVNKNGDIYVADSFNHRIQVFSSNGMFIRKFGTFGVGDGQFNRPYSIALDENGNSYVVDFINHRIQVFNNIGIYIRQFGSPGTLDGQFSFPLAICLDNEGNAYVSDREDRIQVFNANTGVFVRKIGTHGSGDGQFDYISDIAINSLGQICVADAGNSRIQLFSNEGNFLSKIVPNELDNVWGIDLNNENDVFVTNFFLNGVNKFAKPAPSIDNFSNLNKTYGEDDFNLGATTNSTGTITYGLQNSNNNTGDIVLSGLQSKTVNLVKAGTVKLTAHVGEDNNFKSAEKEITLTIDKASLEVKGDNKNRAYGDENPELTITYSGFKNSENAGNSGITTPTISSEAQITSPAGTYPITLLNGDGGDNYQLTPLEGILTVNKTNLTITADNKSRSYGEVNPDLTMTYTGFKNNENASTIGIVAPVISSAANQNSNVGVYSIGLTGGNGGNNYQLALQNGNITINKANQSIAFTSISDMLNSASPFTLDATSSSNLPVSLVRTSGPASVSGNTVTLSGETGEVVVEARQAGNENYHAAPSVSKSFTVNEDLILSTEDPKNSFVQTWPVPATNHLYITSGTHRMSMITLLDVFGRTLFTASPGTTEYNVDVTAYSSGVHTIMITTEKGIVAKRVLIKH